MANVAISFFAAVIAVATVAYVVFTLRLWEATEKTAQAAGKSAEAATAAALAAKKIRRYGRRSPPALHGPAEGYTQNRVGNGSVGHCPGAEKLRHFASHECGSDDRSEE